MELKAPIIPTTHYTFSVPGVHPRLFSPSPGAQSPVSRRPYEVQGTRASPRIRHIVCSLHNPSNGYLAFLYPKIIVEKLYWCI